MGILFLVAGALKITAPNDLAQTIASFRLLPGAITAPLAIFIPIFEIGLGIYLMLGLFSRIASWIATVQLLVFAAVIASVVARGIVTSCGCFGPADTAPATWLDVVRDILLAAVTAFVALKGPGTLAADTWLKRSKTPS